MKKYLSLIALILVVSTVFCEVSTALAEEGIMQIVEEYIQKMVDFSNKDSAVMDAKGYDNNKGIILFDFTAGNHFVMAIDGSQCEIFFYFDDNELMSTMFRMIQEFDTISNKLPKGKTLEYQIRYSDSQSIIITPEIFREYYAPRYAD